MVATADRELSPATGVLRLHPVPEIDDEGWFRGELYRPTSAEYIELWPGIDVTEEAPSHYYAIFRAYEAALDALTSIPNAFMMLTGSTTDTPWASFAWEEDSDQEGVALAPPVERFSMTFDIREVRSGRILPATDEYDE